MANLFTASVTYGGKDSLEAFLKPMVIGNDIYTQAGVRIIPNVQSTMNLQVWSGHQKIVKAYAKGFSGGTGATLATKTLTVVPMKAEAAQDAYAFAQTAYEVVLGKGVEWNNLDAAAQLKAIIQEVFLKAVELDLFRQFWLGDTGKETVTGSTLIWSGTADTDYNAYNGIWKQLIAIASTTPTAGTNVKRVAFSHGSVAQVTTLGTFVVPSAGGDLDVTVAGKTYSVTYATDLSTTLTAFKNAHAAALLLRGITLTNTATTLVFTSAIAGQPFGTITIASGSDISATVTATTANTAPSALTTDEAYTAIASLYSTCQMPLRQLPATEKVFLVTYDVYDNYFQTLHDDGVYTEMGKNMIINGMPALSYQGIPVIPMPWDSFLATDFPTAYPSRIIYTAKNNLILGIDTIGDSAKTEFWFNQDEQENRMRIQFKIGALVMHPDLTAVAY